jgi:hypothetical protein
MKPEARLILVEEIIPDSAETAPGKWLDVLMLAMTGGCERTETEYRDLLWMVGFELEEVVPTSGPLSILIAKARVQRTPENSTAGDRPARFR